MAKFDFVLAGEVLALDLINTEVAVRRKPYDLLQEPTDVQAWWETVRIRYALPIVANEAAPVFDGEMLTELKALRAALRRFFAALVAGQPPDLADLALLNDWLGRGRHTLQADGANGLQAAYELARPDREAIGFQVARSAYELATNQDLARLHKCRNERCVLYFYDHTKSATRHWCSAGCMNRARSVEHYRQSKVLA